MPKSLRCKIKKLCYNGTLTERERDRILKALEQEPTDVVKCTYNTEEIAKSFIEDVEAVKDQLEAQPTDAVSREAVIRLVEQYPNIIGNRYSGLISDIKHLPSVTLTRWVPVSERLPEVGEKVLCQCQANIYEVLKLTVDGWYHDSNHCYMESFVIAWMPLPNYIRRSYHDRK